MLIHKFFQTSDVQGRDSEMNGNKHGHQNLTWMETKDKAVRLHSNPQLILIQYYMNASRLARMLCNANGRVRDKEMIWLAFQTRKLRNNRYVLLQFHCSTLRLERSIVWTKMLEKEGK